MVPRTFSDSEAPVHRGDLRARSIRGLCAQLAIQLASDPFNLAGAWGVEVVAVRPLPTGESQKT
jgi:hypothetical protein